MATLYVTEQGARIEKEYRRINVVKEDQVLLSVPAVRVDHVVLVGHVGTTTPALLSLLDAGVGLSFVNRWGKLRGQLMPPVAKNIPLRHQQYTRATEPAFCLALSRAIVGGKVRNYRTLARRMARSRPDIGPTPFQRMTAAIKAAAGAADLSTLRGLEGSGTKAYFGVLRRTLRQDFGFARRARRPPTDPINALLSLGYSLLTQNIMAACAVVGLDPYDGFFHSDKYGRPALALDLMEEWRGVIVDSVVLNLVNRQRLDAEDFDVATNGGVYLTRRGLTTFFHAYTARLNTEVVHRPSQRRLSYQKLFEVQARQVRRLIEGQRTCYEPYLTR